MTTTIKPPYPRVVPLDSIFQRFLAFEPQVSHALAEGGAEMGLRARPASTQTLLEQEIQERWHVPAVLASSVGGSAALYLALRALGVAPGSEVIVPASAGAGLVSAILALGAVPRVVDIDEATFTLSPEAAARAIRPGMTAALIVPYLFGQPPQMRSLLGLAAEHGRIAVIEDATRAPGVAWIGRYAGASAGGLGDAGYLNISFELPLASIAPSSLLAFRDPAMRDAAIRLREEKQRTRREGGQASLEAWGWTGMNECDVAAVRSELSLLNGWNARQSEIAARYSEAFAGLPLRFVPPVIEGWQHGDLLYPLVTASPDERALLAAYLSSRGVATMPVGARFFAVQRTTYQRFGPSCRFSPAPQAEAVAGAGIALPCYADLTDAQVDQVIRCTCGYYNER